MDLAPSLLLKMTKTSYENDGRFVIPSNGAIEIFYCVGGDEEAKNSARKRMENKTKQFKHISSPPQ